MDKTLYFSLIRFARTKILIVFLTRFVYQAASEAVVVDGTKALKRDTGDGVAYANFAAHKFRYLSIAPLTSVFVRELKECSKLCVDHTMCFSTNLAAVRDENGNILCELLPGDKYNNSKQFINSSAFHHLSIKVSSQVIVVQY